MQPSQFVPRIDAQLLGERCPDPKVVRKRIGLPAGAMEHEHVLAGDPFVQRPGRAPLGQQGQQCGMLTQPQPPFHAIRLRDLPLKNQSLPSRVEPRSVHPCERLPLPQRERLPEQHHRRLVVRGPGPPQQITEETYVHGQFADGDGVPTTPAFRARTTKRPPQPRHIAVERLPRPLRLPVAPYPVHELIDRHRAARVHQQGGQHGPLTKRPQLYEPSADVRLDAAEQPEPAHKSSPPWTGILPVLAFLWRRPTRPGQALPTPAELSHAVAAECKS
ncbi:hypothetical protein QFZ68_005790 [Streptomyces sp. V1I6]|nr:hypothetical protein [Streptomyces sp. V1I6]